MLNIETKQVNTLIHHYEHETPTTKHKSWHHKNENLPCKHKITHSKNVPSCFMSTYFTDGTRYAPSNSALTIPMEKCLSRDIIYYN